MNYFKETYEIIHEEIFNNVFEVLGINKKTKKFWDYIFENHLFPEYFILENASKGSKSNLEVYIRQLELTKEYKEEFESSTLEKMFYKSFVREVFINNLDNAIKVLPKEALKMFIKANSFYIDYKLGKKLLNYLDINELYKAGVVNEALIEENISSFDKNVFYNTGFPKELSTNFIEKHLEDMELLNMHDKETDFRPNIGTDMSPLYENGGCCLEDTHSNGASIYVPYGIWCDIFNAIETSTRCMNKKIDELNESIKKFDVDNEAYQSIKEDLEYDMESLKKQKMLLENFSNLKYSL